MNICLKSLAIVALGSLIAAPAFGANFVDNRNHKETNFDNGRTSPFVQRTTQAPSYARVVGRRLKCKWFESGHSPNSRNTRGAEIWSRVETHNSYFVGFKFRVPKTTGNERFPNNKTTIVHQNMQRTSASGDSTWYCVMEIHNNNLDLRYRTSNGRNHKVHNLIRNIRRDRDYRIQTRMQVGDRGRIEVWIDGSRKLDVRDRVGFGTHNRTIKWGIYAADQTGHVRNETRTLYYDNCSVRVTNNNRGLGDVDPR